MLVAAGCATRVQSNVTTYHAISPSEIQGQTVVVLPADKAKDDSLEFRSEKISVENGLREIGMKVITPDEARRYGVNYVAFFGYATGSGREQLYSYSVPLYGQTGVASSYSSGTINSFGSTSTYSGTTTYTPQYGITGYQSHVGSVTVYDRLAILNIWALQAEAEPRKVYEATVSSSGQSQQVTEVLDEMVAALFNDFWHQGSRNEVVTLRE